MYGTRNAGLAILLITFPLLERYIRQKAGIPSDKDLNPSFYAELVKLFPELKDADEAKDLWSACRNGMLHQVTIMQMTRKGKPLPGIFLTHDIPNIRREANGEIVLNPVDVGERILKAIESDFATFEGGAASRVPLPVVEVRGGMTASTTPFPGPINTYNGTGSPKK